MKKRDFSEWLSTFRRSINGYEYYTDFKKVYENAERLKVEICILNSLVGSSDVETEFESLLNRYPECLKRSLFCLQFVRMKYSVRIQTALSITGSTKCCRPLNNTSILCGKLDFSIC